MVARPQQKKREKVSKQRKKVILIGTEGKNKTEKQYFTSLVKDCGAEYSVRFAKGNYTDPNGILQMVVNGIEEYDLKLAAGDTAYCVFDTDTDVSKQEEIDKAVQKALKKRIKPVLSNPCFEVWFLQHFRKSTRQFGSNAEVLDELEKYIKGYEKNRNVYGELKEMMPQAIENAKLLEQHHNEQERQKYNISRNPSTLVYEIVEQLTCK